jgi:hypothetical protein
MSRDEGFLARWSRRKRLSEAGPDDAANPPRATSSRKEEPQDAASPSLERSDGASIIEPERLPPIESLDAASDVKPFLAPEVPPQLTRRALRRAWVVDTTIRNFIGLSENGWDFTAPDGVPGFGSLSAEDVARLLAQATGPVQSRHVSPPTEGQGAATPIDSLPQSREVAPQRAMEDGDRKEERPDRPTQCATDAATQQENDEKDEKETKRQRHGGALPK